MSRHGDIIISVLFVNFARHFLVYIVSFCHIFVIDNFNNDSLLLYSCRINLVKALHYVDVHVIILRSIISN